MHLSVVCTLTKLQYLNIFGTQMYVRKTLHLFQRGESRIHYALQVDDLNEGKS